MNHSTDESDEEIEIAIEHLDLILKGQEEHPLLPNTSPIGLDGGNEPKER